MNALGKNSMAAMTFELIWQSAEAGHRELFYGPDVNMWRDIFPAPVDKEILGAREDKTYIFSFEPGVLVPAFSPTRVLDISPGQFRDINVSGRKIKPSPGRFYPSGLLCNVPGIFPQSLAPCRVVEVDQDRIRVDLNHPLSTYVLELKIQVRSIRKSTAERGGRCNAWVEEITSNGPGMQVRANGHRTVFENSGSYQRLDENDDPAFYAAPRLVGHVDHQASSLLQEIYARFFNKNDRVLDLMSSVQSHLPEGLDLTTTGLGMNMAELKKNRALSRHIVHDLNETPILPFDSSFFDVVVCSLSIEYLTSPREIINEVSRVLTPGGRVLISFSNRWFPPKVTRLWQEIHDFERLGLVLDYLLDNGSFTDLSTFSARNWPRPANDRHAGEIAASDPIFVAAAVKKLL